MSPPLPPFARNILTNDCSDTFVYEYVGEVIGPAPFARRMKEYAQEGIRHFYFMALDREIVSPILRTLLDALTWSVAVHRRDEEGREGTIPQPLVQPELRRRQVDDRKEDAYGNIYQAGCQEGRGAHVQLQRRSIRVSPCLLVC